jgi:hypothetical protein
MDDAQIHAQLQLLRDAIRPQQWEYESIPFGGDGDLAKLKQHGIEGWEAVAMASTGARFQILMKRPLRR